MFKCPSIEPNFSVKLFQFLVLLIVSCTTALPLPFLWGNVGSGEYALQIHEENIKQIMNFQRRFEEAKLLSQYGPAFASEYSYEDKVRTAKLMKTIRQLHMQGNYKK